MPNIMLLVQTDKHFRDGRKIQTSSSAEAQLIAKAVAAFSWNNHQQQETGQPLLESKVCIVLILFTRVNNDILIYSQIISGIVMKGTLSIFFKIPVTQQLVTAIMHPAEPTIVAVHSPDLPQPNLSWSEGMEPLDTDRQHILKCFKTFKAIVGVGI